ncbi:spinster family MFS transporter [Halopseudomonas aestusnigri]|uniref:Sugar phosphate permease n=1 Tax=Halopseudomonas aestusnigri TaxID=857252 RepID=A0AAQ1G708_9GAMM|nr:MFS transporter [Halopseudomonas aestusnigri]OWL89240.1 MFS transporter [Halopseudomonas aestusnigri]SEG06693.1 Sugar phosphate permease [Halopseudomonas aestusnigri]
MSNAAVTRSLGWRAHGLLSVLVFAYAGFFIGRQIMSIMIEPIKQEFGASDTAMGLISGLAFAAVYALMGLPAGRLADRGSRVRLLAFAGLLWGLSTLLCGLATSFWLLVAARMLVAVFEAPVTPASLSLIADLYPVQQRSLAISFFTGAPTVSAMLGLGVGAWVIDIWGWRSGFYLIASPVLLVSVVLGLLVREPRRGYWDANGSSVHAPRHNLRQAAAHLFSNRPYRLTVLICTLFSFSGFAFAMWNTSFLIRSHGLSLQHAGILAGVVVGGTATVGGLFSGWLTDRLVVVDRRWLVWVPLIGQSIALAFMLSYLMWPVQTAFHIGSMPVPTTMFWCALMGFFTVWWVAPLFNLLTQLVDSWERATAVALQTICTTVAGVGLGPLFIGALSDMLAPFSGDESLRQAMLLANVSLFVALLLLLRLLRQPPFRQ